MPTARPVFAGIDVGNTRKGFHAVSLRAESSNPGVWSTKAMQSCDAQEVARWCQEEHAIVVAVDCPCRWSRDGRSRAAERDLKVAGVKISIFATPTREIAESHTKGFFDWIFNGEKLYQELTTAHFPLYDGKMRNGPACIETFPHGVVCGLAGKVVRAKPKNANRRKVLGEYGINNGLSNLDFVDAALCALTAQQFALGQTLDFGIREEGFIVIPKR